MRRCCRGEEREGWGGRFTTLHGIWPVISEDVQERCLKRISGRVRFIEGLLPQLQTQATVDAASDQPEQLLLAYVFGKFKESDLLGVKTEAEKMLMLAALNLVECIAETAPRLTM